MDAEVAQVNEEYVPNMSSNVTHKIYYVGVLYLKSIVMRVAVEPWIQKEMDQIAVSVAEQLLEQNNIMTTIREFGNQQNKQNRGKIQVFKMD